LLKSLIIRFSSLGDVLLTTPLIRIFKKKYPEAHIDFLVKEAFADTLKFNPALSSIKLFTKEKESLIVRELKSESYDLIIDLQNNFRSKKIRNLLKGKVLVFKKPTLKKFLLVNFKINLFDEILPIPERYLRTVPELENDGEGLDLYLPEGLECKNAENTEYIGLCPGAKHFTKRYPAEYFVELGNKISKFGYKIKVLGGRDERELCGRIANEIELGTDSSNNNNLFATAREMLNCKAVICNDSGLMHVAAALKIPVVAIFGSSVREFGFEPYKIKSLILENNSLTCRPCSHIGRNKCPKEHFKCMMELRPNAIFEKIMEFLNTL